MVLREFSLAQTGATEIRSIPEWSTKHFEDNDRPLRIAVDQASWWYHNITVEKDAEIRSKSPGSHPREERIMERIAYLLRMNIHLLFIFDGPKRPARNWPSTHAYTDANIRFLKELLDQLHVPRHDAPGEAAAECVRLQDLGIVDAIWTDNTDILVMGGNPTLVSLPPSTDNDYLSPPDTVIVCSAAQMKDRANLTWKWFLMYATLVGCSYTDGLPGFTAPKFLRFAQDPSFQAAANLLAAGVETTLTLPKWRGIITSMIHTISPSITLPPTFPDPKILLAIAHPSISPDPLLLTLPCLKNGWFHPYGPNLLPQYRFLLTNFHKSLPPIWVSRLLIPIQLTHILLTTPTQLPHLEIWSKHRPCPTTTITLDPLRVLPELQTAFPSELYTITNGSRTKIPIPTFRLEEFELLDVVIRRALPDPNHTPKIPPIPAAGWRTTGSLQRQRPAPLALAPHAHTVLDTSDSPSCITFHQGLTLPGDIDWYQPPASSPVVLSPHAMSAHTVRGEFPETSGLGMMAPLSMMKQPIWDHLAGFDVVGEFER